MRGSRRRFRRGAEAEPTWLSPRCQHAARGAVSQQSVLWVGVNWQASVCRHFRPRDFAAAVSSARLHWGTYTPIYLCFVADGDLSPEPPRAMRLLPLLLAAFAAIVSAVVGASSSQALDVASGDSSGSSQNITPGWFVSLASRQHRVPTSSRVLRLTVVDEACARRVQTKFNCSEIGCDDIVAGYVSGNYSICNSVAPSCFAVPPIPLTFARRVQVNYIEFYYCTVPDGAARIASFGLLLLWLLCVTMERSSRTETK